MMGRNEKRPVKGRFTKHPGGEGDYLKWNSHHLSKPLPCPSPGRAGAAPILTQSHWNPLRRTENDGFRDGLRNSAA